MVDNESLKQLLAERRAQKDLVSKAEWEARVELAACYRLIAHFRMTDWIYNHISARVPGGPRALPHQSLRIALRRGIGI